MFGRVKLDNTFLTYDQGNCNQISGGEPELNPSNSGVSQVHQALHF